MRKWLLVGLVLGMMGGLISTEVLAQDRDRGMQRMDEIVVSATRTETPVFDTAQSVTVISREDLDASPFERAEDIVRNVPGMYNFRHFALQTNGIVSPLVLRGVGKNKVLVLVDGVPQNDNFNNAIAWVGWGHIPKETIERIEIVRGPTSALYGSEGLGGVIHIITKKPQTERVTSVRGEAGNGETYGGFASHSQKIGDIGFLLAGGYEESDGFYMVSNPEPYEIRRYRELARAFGKVSYDLDDRSDLTLSALYYDHDMGQGRKYFHNDLQLDQYWLTYSRRGDGLGIKALAYLNRGDKTAYQDDASTNFSSLLRKEKFPETYTWGADLQGTIPVADWFKFTLGSSYKQLSWKYEEDYVNSPREGGAEGEQLFLSPFANADFLFFDKSLIVNLGARYDWIRTMDGSNFDTQAAAGVPAYDNKYDSSNEKSFSPKAGIAYHPDEKTTLRASAGKGFRAPSLFELYKVQVRGGGTFYRFANPDLEPEEIWSYDVGAERYLTNSLWGKVSFYQSFAKDYIGDRFLRSVQFGPPANRRTRNEYILDNLNEVDIYGIETELQWYATNDLTFLANYTYNISKIEKDKSDKSLEGNYLANDPRHKLHAGIRYQNPEIVNFSIMLNYYAKIYYDLENRIQDNDFWTVDVSVSRKFFNWMTAYVNVENLFDKDYPL
ncbi:MAG: TonB-dependent receptor plug domain-containing protein, partial [Kiritimatiellia bacterium]